MITIDVNCDLGEGTGNEAFIMPLISSCNIACGGHAGDRSTMETVVGLAKKYAVKIGAHPSFPDQPNFGRKVMNISAENLSNSLVEQINALRQILNAEGLELHHIKPHGALYNLAAVDANTASIIVDVIIKIDASTALYAPFGSVISKIATEKGLKVVFEAFADRNYNQDLTLVSRANNDALIDDPEIMFHHVSRMILDKKVTTLNGEEVAIKADTFCVHSDGRNVVKNLESLIFKLKQNNIEIS
ncbi:5-oxoprolinase subunit PxpA [uncultured Psychroserpens sp.]|uniref:5-oxoprolinase subunit PxpA n=1 Tax=uncultured Psychroserpens sp. TaxID=255436 RepID=UPI00262447C8|nr:5-oxoprolinase subunit PxpA [uncultured Psychroserpens sp.]